MAPSPRSQHGGREKALANAGRLTKSAGFDDLARAAVAGLREVDSRLSALEKQAADSSAARFGFGAADTSQARIAILESEIAALRASESSAGLAKTLERGCATQGPKTERSPSLGCAVDWRQ